MVGVGVVYLHGEVVQPGPTICRGGYLLVGPRGVEVLEPEPVNEIGLVGVVIALG